MLKSMLPMPNIAGVSYESVVDGEGVRATIFLSGCPHHCPSCHNPQAQDINYGKPATRELIEEIRAEIKKRPFLRGVTLSGGDPMYQPQATFHLLQRLGLVDGFDDKSKFDLWIYTGYTIEELGRTVRDTSELERACALMLMLMSHYIVDGRFIANRRNKTLAFRGSDNQRIIEIVPTFNAEGFEKLTAFDRSSVFDSVNQRRTHDY